MRKKFGTKKFDSMMKKSLHYREARSFKRANKNRCVCVDVHYHLVLQKLKHAPLCMTTNTILPSDFLYITAFFHRPREMSSKRPVSRFREVVPVVKDKLSETRDPRFEETAGKLNSDLFKKSYAFVDELKKKEKQLIKREVHKTKSAGKKAKLQKLLLQMVLL